MKANSKCIQNHKITVDGSSSDTQTESFHSGFRNTSSALGAAGWITVNLLQV